MDITGVLIDIIRYSIPALLVLGATYMILEKFFGNEEKKRFLELRKANQSTTLPIRLQAYERMALLLERISLDAVILRIKKPRMNASDLYSSIMTEIKAEFDHNLSQQVYISNDAWHAAIQAKQDILKLVNEAYAEVGTEASGLDLSKAIFDALIKMENSPTQTALFVLRREAQQLF